MMQETRCGFVALIGAPNAGKSTLLNQFVGAKVSIVSSKIQTTRTKVLGIRIYDKTQIIFVDTPGLFKPQKTLEKAMVNAAEKQAQESDVNIFVVDVEKCLKNASYLIDLVSSLKIDDKKCYLALNKIDLVKKSDLLQFLMRVDKEFNFLNIYLISATDGDGVEDMLDNISSHLPYGPWLFPEDQISDMPMRLMAAEITREKLFLLLNEELPYSITVETEKWEEKQSTSKKQGSVSIHQIIYVKRDNHKPIVLGKGGQKIKKVGIMARKELEEILDYKVNLFIHVKTDKNWEHKNHYYSLWGLEKL